jgi:hypothetical protein
MQDLTEGGETEEEIELEYSLDHVTNSGLKNRMKRHFEEDGIGLVHICPVLDRSESIQQANEIQIIMKMKGNPIDEILFLDGVVYVDFLEGLLPAIGNKNCKLSKIRFNNVSFEHTSESIVRFNIVLKQLFTKNNTMLRKLDLENVSIRSNYSFGQIICDILSHQRNRIDWLCLRDSIKKAETMETILSGILHPNCKITYLFLKGSNPLFRQHAFFDRLIKNSKLEGLIVETSPEVEERLLELAKKTSTIRELRMKNMSTWKFNEIANSSWFEIALLFLSAYLPSHSSPRIPTFASYRRCKKSLADFANTIADDSV